jgi:hypothetical protein
MWRENRLYIFFMYLINYFIYLYNFKAIYDVTGSTTGPTPVGPVVREPLPFPVLFPVRFLKPWLLQNVTILIQRVFENKYMHVFE